MARLIEIQPNWFEDPDNITRVFNHPGSVVIEISARNGTMNAIACSTSWEAQAMLTQIVAAVNSCNKDAVSAGEVAVPQ